MQCHVPPLSTMPIGKTDSTVNRVVHTAIELIEDLWTL